MAADIVNVEQAEAWNGPEGEYWATHQARFDATIRPYHTDLMEAAGIAPGEKVLDIGCGNGVTSRDAARAAGPGGEVLAVDLSGPMLGRAAQQAKDDGIGNIRFEQADAQVYPFDAGAFDVAMSRFGVMFFADPVAAFANIGSALRSGGRLTMLVWGPLTDNEWITALREALAVGRNLPMPPPGAPGPFALADTDFTRGILTDAGFTDVDVSRSWHRFLVGSNADDAYTFLAGLNPVKVLLADLDDTQKAEALDNLRDTIADHETGDGVVFGSSAWLVTARKP
jgi:SAM-dependent methyltransferase